MSARSAAAAAQELHARGLGANEEGQPARAARALRRALQLLDRGDGTASGHEAAVVRARVLITLANSEFEMAGFVTAMRTLGEAARIVERHSLDFLRSALHNQRGLFLLRDGQQAPAMQEFDLAAQWFADGAPAEVCRVLLNRGTLRMYDGQLRPARADLVRCAELAAQSDLDILRFKAMHNLGYLEFLAGNLPDALRLIDEAPDVREIGGWGMVNLDRARILAESGLTREADQHLAEAQAIFARERAAHDLAETVLERARCALIQGDVTTARHFAADARTRFRRRGNDQWRRSAELVLLDGDLAAGRPGSRLVEPALRLHADFERDAARSPARTAALIAAEAMLGSGRVEAAGALLSRIGPSRRVDAITLRLRTRYVRARLDVARARPRAASRAARAALTELAAYQASFGSIDLATAAAVHGRRLARLDLSLAIASGRPDAVFDAAEFGRATTNRLTPVRPPKDPELAELLADLRRTVEQLRGTSPPAETRALLARRTSLEEGINALGWRRSGGTDVAATVSLEQVRAELGDAVLVSYVRSGELLHAVVVDRDGARLAVLGAADPIAEGIRRLRADLDVLAHPLLPGGLRGSATASLERLVADLDETLLGGLTSSGFVLGGRRLVVGTTGLLGQLPWGLLPSLRGVPVVSAPSATAWQVAASRPRSRHRRVTAIAGPGLDRAADEAGAVAASWPGAQAFEGSAATGKALAEAFGSARLVHVAAHGTHQTENPLFSSLRMADGPLFAHELDQTARTPEHVVLSACELGLATVRPGDEALGLTSVLLRLGTRCVVSGVARVADALAETTMRDYHRRLAAGHDSAAALASALADTDGVPAPFVCFGASWATRRTADRLTARG